MESTDRAMRIALSREEENLPFASRVILRRETAKVVFGVRVRAIENDLGGVSRENTNEFRMQNRREGELR